MSVVTMSLLQWIEEEDDNYDNTDDDRDDADAIKHAVSLHRQQNSTTIDDSITLLRTIQLLSDIIQVASWIQKHSVNTVGLSRSSFLQQYHCTSNCRKHSHADSCYHLNVSVAGPHSRGMQLTTHDGRISDKSFWFSASSFDAAAAASAAASQPLAATAFWLVIPTLVILAYADGPLGVAAPAAGASCRARGR